MRQLDRDIARGNCRAPFHPPSLKGSLMIEFKYETAVDGTFYFNIVSNTGQILCSSIRNESGVVLALQQMAIRAGNVRYEVLASNDPAQPWYWRILDLGQRVIAKSETYHNRTDAQSSADWVKTYAR